MPCRLLVYLAANRDRVVPKTELAREVWGSLSIDEASLHQAIRKARRAVGDDGRKQAVIETVARRGYRFAAKIENDATAPDRAGAVHVPYVGRRPLLDALAGHVAALSEGRGALVLLEGEAGVGKTRTVDELMAFAARAGVPAVRGGANPPAGAPPFWAWNEALRTLSKIRPMTTLREAVPHLFQWPPAPSAEEAEPERFRDLRRLASGLHELARSGPLVIVLEDLHAAGFSTWEMVEYVASHPGSAPLMLLATYRPAAIASSDAWHPIERRIVESGLGRHHPIPPLGEIETAYLVEQSAGRPIPGGALQDLHRHTLGIPFYAVQLAESLGAETDADNSEPWRERIERSAVDLLRGRLSRLSDAARSVISLASVFGPAFDAYDLQRLAHGHALGDALHEAAALHLVRRSPSDDDVHQFAHALVRDALYFDFMTRDESGCRAAHLAVARILGPDDPTAIAHHLCAAGRLAGSTAIAEGVARAARASASAGDLEGAVALYDDAIRSLDAFVPHDDPDRLEMLIASGELGVRSTRPDRARALLTEAIGIARTSGRGDLLARGVLARVHRTEIVGLADPETIGLLKEAIDALGEGAEGVSARLHSRLAIELRYAPDGRAEATQEIDVALSLAHEAADPRAIAGVLEDASLVRWSVADPEAWLELNEAIVAAAREAGDTELLFQGVKGLATAHLELGDRPAFEREMGRCEEIAEAHPSPFLRAVVAGLRGTRAFLDADLPAAERFALEGASAGLDAITPLAAGQLYYHRLESGRLAETEGALRSFAAESPGVAIWPIALARCLVATHRTDEARDALRRLGELDAIPKDRNWLPAIALFAESAVIARDHELARSARSALEPYARVNVVMGNGSLFAGQTTHYLGMLCGLLGDLGHAETYLDHALEMHRAMSAESWCLRTQAEQLHVAAAASERGRDREEAAAAVIDRAEDLDLVECAARARAAIGS